MPFIEAKFRVQYNIEFGRYFVQLRAFRYKRSTKKANRHFLTVSLLLFSNFEDLFYIKRFRILCWNVQYNASPLPSEKKIDIIILRPLYAVQYLNIFNTYHVFACSCLFSRIKFDCLLFYVERTLIYDVHVFDCACALILSLFIWRYVSCVSVTTDTSTSTSTFALINRLLVLYLKSVTYKPCFDFYSTTRVIERLLTTTARCVIHQTSGFCWNYHFRLQPNNKWTLRWPKPVVSSFE